MADYKELVSELRNMHKAYVLTDNENSRAAKTIKGAADAIESLMEEATLAFCGDRISLKTAVETAPWMFVWAAEPERKVFVDMTYDDLWNIVKKMGAESE